MLRSPIRILPVVVLWFVPAALLLGLTTPGHAQTLRINEVLVDPNGTDAPNEYIEIRATEGTQQTVPANTYFLAIEGDAGATVGHVQFFVNISGETTTNSGYLTLLQAGNPYGLSGDGVFTAAGGSGWTDASVGLEAGTDMENSTTTFLLVTATTPPMIGDDLDTDDDGELDLPAGMTVIDSIGIANNDDPSEALYGAINYAPTGTTIARPVGSALVEVGFTPAYVGRNGLTSGSAAADWVAAGDATISGAAGTLDNTDVEPASRAGAALDHLNGPNFGAMPPSSLVLDNRSPSSTLVGPLRSLRSLVATLDISLSGSTSDALTQIGWTVNIAGSGTVAEIRRVDILLESDGTAGPTAGDDRLVGMNSPLVSMNSTTTALNVALSDAEAATLYVILDIVGADGATYSWQLDSATTMNGLNPTGLASQGTPIETRLGGALDGNDQTQVWLNEIKVDAPAGPDADFQFIELRGPANRALFGMFVVIVEGDGVGSGEVDAVFDLRNASLGANGLLLLVPTNHPYSADADTTVIDAGSDLGMETGAISVLLVQSVNPIAIGANWDPENSGTPLGLPSTITFLDAVGWTDGDATDHVYGSANISSFFGISFTPDAVARGMGNDAQQSAASWYGGILVGGSASLMFNPSNRTGNAPPTTSADLTPGGPNLGVLAAFTPPSDSNDDCRYRYTAGGGLPWLAWLALATLLLAGIRRRAS